MASPAKKTSPKDTTATKAKVAKKATAIKAVKAVKPSPMTSAEEEANAAYKQEIKGATGDPDNFVVAGGSDYDAHAAEPKTDLAEGDKKPSE